jgi:hypothetical protein
MDANAIISLINVVMAFALQLVKMGQQLYGKEAIPNLDTILANNIALQEKIDAEKKVV